VRVDRETVEKIARLARLELDENEIELMVRDLSAVLEYAERLPRLEEVEGILPVPPAAPSRDDEPGPKLAPGAATRDAPDASDHLFRVPPAIEES